MNELELKITYQGNTYTLTYNAQTGFYETELTAPQTRWGI